MGNISRERERESLREREEERKRKKEERWREFVNGLDKCFVMTAKGSKATKRGNGPH